jgi:hypothetical protein
MPVLREYDRTSYNVLMFILLHTLLEDYMENQSQHTPHFPI